MPTESNFVSIQIKFYTSLKQALMCFSNTKAKINLMLVEL